PVPEEAPELWMGGGAAAGGGARGRGGRSARRGRAYGFPLHARGSRFEQSRLRDGRRESGARTRGRVGLPRQAAADPHAAVPDVVSVARLPRRRAPADRSGGRRPLAGRRGLAVVRTEGRGGGGGGGSGRRGRW